MVRSYDGRMQHIRDGGVVYEVPCKGSSNSPLALLGDDIVVLAASDKGAWTLRARSGGHG